MSHELPPCAPDRAHCHELMELSDGFHTMRELYTQRGLWHALFVNLCHRGDMLGTYFPRNVRTTKAWRHSDGEPCFGYTAPGTRWFVVTSHLVDGIETDQVTQHYPESMWELFHVPETEVAPEWDGHTPAQADARLMDYIERQGNYRRE